MIVWLDFSKICLPHPSTMASLMFCHFAKFLPKGKTWGRTRQRPTMADFHRKVNKFWQRFAKCDPCLIVIVQTVDLVIILWFILTVQAVRSLPAHITVEGLPKAVTSTFLKTTPGTLKEMSTSEINFNSVDHKLVRALMPFQQEGVRSVFLKMIY